MSGNAIVLSVRPKFANKIIDGSKTVELRRRRPRQVTSGTLAIIYASAPVKALIGAFIVDDIVEEDIDLLWDKVKKSAEISQDEFISYFDGASKGIGIFIRDVWSFPKPVGLQDLKQNMSFLPPQSFRYVRESELSSVYFSNFGVGKK
jgi:predicted transcriptional regulator